MPKIARSTPSQILKYCFYFSDRLVVYYIKLYIPVTKFGAFNFIFSQSDTKQNRKMAELNTCIQLRNLQYI